MIMVNHLKHDTHKLPVWAQDLIAQQNREIERLQNEREILDPTPIGWRCFLDNFHYLPKHADVRYWLTPDQWIDVQLERTLYGDDDPFRLNIIGRRRLVITPCAANHLWVGIDDRRH